MKACRDDDEFGFLEHWSGRAVVRALALAVAFGVASILPRSIARALDRCHRLWSSLKDGALELVEREPWTLAPLTFACVVSVFWIASLVSRRGSAAPSADRKPPDG